MILEEIINNLREQYRINLSGNFERKNPIENIYKLNDDIYFPLIEKTLYFITDQSIENLLIEKIPSLKESYIMKVPDLTLQENLYEETIRQLNDKKSLEEESAKLFSIIRDGKGLDLLVNEAHKFLNNPISICDSSFSIIASCPKVKDKTNLVTTENKQYLKDGKFQDMLDRNIIEHLYNSKKSIITKVKNINYRYLFQSIQVGNNTIGYICVRETVSPITEEDQKYLDILAEMLAIELQKELFYRNIPPNNYESYFIDLIKGEHIRSDILKKRLLKNIRGQNAYYSIGLFETSSDLSISKQRFLQDEISMLIPSSISTYYEGNIVVLIASKSTDPIRDINRERLKTFIKSNKLKLYLSYSFMDLKSSHIYYNQIKDLAYENEISNLINGTLIQRYEDFYLEHLFQKYPDKSQLIATIHPDIRKLYDYDKEYKTEFLLTLQTYLEQNRNAKKAAEILHIHKSTFFYRIGKIEDLFGITIKDSNKLFAYEYSLKLLNFLS